MNSTCIQIIMHKMHNSEHNIKCSNRRYKMEKFLFKRWGCMYKFSTRTSDLSTFTMLWRGTSGTLHDTFIVQTFGWATGMLSQGAGAAPCGSSLIWWGHTVMPLPIYETHISDRSHCSPSLWRVRMWSLSSTSLESQDLAYADQPWQGQEGAAW